jgi:hypothetical protein
LAADPLDANGQRIPLEPHRVGEQRPVARVTQDPRGDRHVESAASNAGAP